LCEPSVQSQPKVWQHVILIASLLCERTADHRSRRKPSTPSLPQLLYSGDPPAVFTTPATTFDPGQTSRTNLFFGHSLDHAILGSRERRDRSARRPNVRPRRALSWPTPFARMACQAAARLASNLERVFESPLFPQVFVAAHAQSPPPNRLRFLGALLQFLRFLPLVADAGQQTPRR